MNIKNLLMLILLISASISTAQEETVRLRIMQLSYDKQGDDAARSNINIWIDGESVFEAVGFPFTTDYITLSPGIHTLATSITGDNAVSASTEIELEAGQRYTVIAGGNYSESDVAYVMVNESVLAVNELGSAIILVNRFPRSVNVYIDDALAVENLAPGEHTFISPPQADFTAHLTTSSDPDTILFSGEYTAIPGTTFLTVIYGSSAGDVFPIIHRSSEMTIAEYLQRQIGSEPFGDIAALIESAGVDLSGEGPYTLFLPENDSLETLPEGALKNHILPGNLPPYELVRMESLTTLNGNTISMNSGETESGYWEIEGAPVLWEVRCADGVIYLIDGVIVPQ